MKKILRTYLNPPGLTNYERRQRRKTLNFIFIASAIGALLLGIVNLIIFADGKTIALFFFTASILCGVGIGLNHKGYYLTAAIMLWGLVFFAANFILIRGNGLHDPGIMCYPILIILIGLLFGRRAIPAFTVFVIISLIFFSYFEFRDNVQSEYLTALADLITLATLLSASAVVMWVIMENTEKNLRRIKESETRLIETYDMTLEGWAKAMEYRDSDTEGHCRRVVSLAVQLATQLGCTEEEINHIKRGVLLHDIGKIAIPDAILYKPGPLNSREREMIEKHPIYAREMLSQIPYLKTAITIPYYHHERWDGNGYPEGLYGEEIPIYARIFSVIDVWDALRSNRPYRGAWPYEKAVSYIKENAGKMFDPRVVDGFINLVGGIAE